MPETSGRFKITRFHRYTGLGRMLKMIGYMRRGKRSIGDIANHVGITQKTVRRYIAVLEEHHVPICVVDEYMSGQPKLWWIERTWEL